jgi:hypothetical protein
MIDEEIWSKLSAEEKLAELEKYLNEFRRLDSGEHELRGTYHEGKIKTLKTELKQKINKIIDLEYIK